MQLNDFLPYRLSILSLKISNGIAQHYAEYGIDIPQWRVMVILGQHAHINATQIVQYSQMDKVRVSRTMKRLLSQQLIEIETDPSDGRAKRYHLSPSGEKLVQQIMPRARAFEQRLYDALSAEERDNLDQIIRKLEQTVAQETELESDT